MAQLTLATVALGALVAASGAALEHRVRIDHHSGPIDVHYRGSVDVTHQQIGSVAPGGRGTTLRCLWRAKVIVDRAARHSSGAVLARSFENADVVEGSRPGWCSTQRREIAREVAQRTDEVRRHLLTAASHDHPVLTAEADRLHRSSATG